jgi:hypothetical protein
MKWNRGVSQLGYRDEERLIQKQLEQRWPEKEYPVHITIVGAADTTAVAVQIWNATGTKIIEKAYPEEYISAAQAHPLAAAALAKVDEIISRLKKQQKL